LKQILYENTKISYCDTGKGKAIVLLHSFLENKMIWQDLFAKLSKKYSVITIDLLGRGNTATNK